jgi:hypothetical protein
MNDRTLIRDLAALICRTHHFARDIGRLNLYQEGVYSAGAEFFIRQQVKRILAQFDKTERWSSGLAREVIEYILLDTPELDPRPPEHLINLQNGLLNIWSRELLPHTPGLLSTLRVPIRYDPSAGCERIDEFLAQVFPGRFRHARLGSTRRPINTGPIDSEATARAYSCNWPPASWAQRMSATSVCRS